MEYRTLYNSIEAAGATLVAVSKTHSAEAIHHLYAQGHRHFGENRVQELVDKQATLPADIHWHFIGHLQRNKVKYIAPFVHLIHGVDSTRLLQEINKQAERSDRTIDVLLQFHVASEDSKYGLTEVKARTLLDELPAADRTHVRICGVMGMATYTSDAAVVRAEFRRLRGIFQQLRQDYFSDAPHFREISMGMSGDYPVALEEGSTMVRIGSLLFGKRS